MAHGLITREREGEYNPETSGKNRELHPRRIVLEIRGFTFDITMRATRYIWDALGSEHWHQLEAAARDRATTLLEDAARAGLIGEAGRAFVEPQISAFCRQRVYQLFQQAMFKAGNGAWEVPETLL